MIERRTSGGSEKGVHVLGQFEAGRENGKAARKREGWKERVCL